MNATIEFCVPNDQWVTISPCEIEQKIAFLFLIPFDFDENWHTFRVLLQRHTHEILALPDPWGQI